MNKGGMDKILEAFRKKDDFLIVAHINPEGDSVGSQLAVCYLLEQMGKKCVMVSRDDVPDNLKFLNDTNRIKREIPENFHVRNIVVLDCPVKERVGDMRAIFQKKQFVINIDHHVSNEFFGDLNWVEPAASSTGEMLFRLIRHAGVNPTKVANALYAAIVTDTGMFNYDNTAFGTHEVAGELVKNGVNPKTMHREIFEKKSAAEIKLLGKSLGTLQVTEGGKIAYMSLTRKMRFQAKASKTPTDAFINFPRAVQGVEVALFFKETSSGKMRTNVSFRSTKIVSVNTIASCFGGGGHNRAAGCVIESDIAEARRKVLKEVRKALKRAA